MDVTFTLDTIQTAATTLLQQIGQRKVIALHGEMGAGKTTLVHAIGEVLGVKEAVSSPTFSIINTYTTAQQTTLYHLDLYRLKSAQEAIGAGVEDCLYSGDLCLVEWPTITPQLLPDDAVHVYITSKGNNERLLQIKL